MIFGVNTIPEYRSRGCAGELLARAILDARQQGRRGLVLTCKDRLLAYYAKFGFANEGVSVSTSGIRCACASEAVESHDNRMPWMRFFLHPGHFLYFFGWKVYIN